MSQAGTPAAPWAAVGGAPLLTFLVALAGTTWPGLLLAPAGRQRSRAGTGRAQRRAGARLDRWRAGAPPGSWQSALRRRALPGLAFAGAAGLALAGALLPVDQQVPGTPTAIVAAVQGNVPHARSLPDLLRASTVTANHAAATEHLAARVKAGALPAPDLVIWPENSTDLDPTVYPQVYATIAAAVNAIHRPVLVGAVLTNPLRNAGQLWLPGRGPGTTYVKRQLVPFGEYIPFRGLLSQFTSLVELQPQNFTAGHRAVVFRVGQIRLGDVICYEVGFDDLVSSEVNAGANLLAVQTNDATFEVDGQRGETLQQLAMARIRAVESNRAVVVASTTGVSAIIAPDGRLLAHTGTWQRAVLEARVPLRQPAHSRRPDRRLARGRDRGPHPRRARLGRHRASGARAPQPGNHGAGAAEVASAVMSVWRMGPSGPVRRAGGSLEWERAAPQWGHGGVACPGEAGQVRRAGGGALPVLAFPAPNIEFLAWFGLVPGLLLMRASPSAREAAVRGWWFGAGFIWPRHYWLLPNIGPALLLVAVVLGALWTRSR